MTERPRRLTILHVVAPASFGGIESVIRSLAVGHARRGHTVRVVSVLSPRDADPHSFVAALTSDGIATETVRLGARAYREEWRTLRTFIQRHAPDVVHTHGFRSDVIGGGVARRQGVATVSTCHGFIDSDWRGRLYQWAQRRALRRFDAVVAVSTRIAERLLAAGLQRTRVHLVPNGFATNGRALLRSDARQVLELPDAPIIGWVGRLSSEKGPDLAIEALARMRNASARLVMIGSGRDEAALRVRAAGLGIADRVLWRGAVPNAGALFAAFDVFLLSSRTEGTPIALFEAMAANVPVVATRVGGVPAVVDDGSSARLTESGDADAMARALDASVGDPVGAQVLATRARARLDERFAIEPWLSHYERIYAEARERPRTNGHR